MGDRSTAAHLSTLLAGSAAFGITSQPTFLADTAEDACACVLDRLQTCQLPRAVRIFIDQTHGLTFEVVGGRITAVSEIGDPNLRVQWADVIARPLRASEENDVEWMSDLFRAVFADGQRLSFDISGVDGALEHAAAGIGPSQIRNALKLALAEDGAVARLDCFEAAVNEVLIGHRNGQGETCILQDNVTLPPDLLDALDRLLNSDSGLAKTLGQDEILILSDVQAGAFTVALLQSEGVPTAYIFEAGCGADLASVWADFPHLGLRLPNGVAPTDTS